MFLGIYFSCDVAGDAVPDTLAFDYCGCRELHLVLIVADSLLLECSSFDPASEPPGITTMDWGVAACCKEGVPDVCYENGVKEREAIIYFFGEDPIDVTNNIIMISNRIINIEL